MSFRFPGGRRRIVIAVLGPTAAGKSRLGIALAQTLDGEIVNCDSTAVYRRFDIGTDKVPDSERMGVPHHLIDIVEPIEPYSAARFANDAAAVIREIDARGRWPILVGGTGFYYRALVRGLFPGPARHDALRHRLDRIAGRRGPAFLHKALRRVDPDSAHRVQPGDQKRLVRALEVYVLTGRPMSAHFANTRSPLADYAFVSIGLQLPSALTAERVARRVDDQFARGVVDEVRRMLGEGIPETAHPFSGLVYRQVLDMLHGVRGEAETRALIVRENRKYARRQLIWFRKEPNLQWLNHPGEQAAALAGALDVLRSRGIGR
ncbi:MAG: tRNA (adenosine(37)-N6)-dimethylallyltransferase MiaA [Vicinamibacterales bacterium]